ncbi:hypothetical protein D3C80_825780 [compost metagenome]
MVSTVARESWDGFRSREALVAAVWASRTGCDGARSAWASSGAASAGRTGAAASFGAVAGGVGVGAEAVGATAGPPERATPSLRASVEALVVVFTGAALERRSSRRADPLRTGAGAGVAGGGASVSASVSAWSAVAAGTVSRTCSGASDASTGWAVWPLGAGCVAPAAVGRGVTVIETVSGIGPWTGAAAAVALTSATTWIGWAWTAG